MTGLFIPGDSILHRLPAGLKLVLLVVAAAVLSLWRTPLVSGVGLAVVCALYPVAGFGLRVWWAQTRPVLLVLVVIGAAQWWARDLPSALVVAGSLLALILLAALVTLTTRTTALVEAMVLALRPFRRWGVDPDRIALLLALGIRSVPVVVDLAAEVRQAQQARGLTASPRAFAVPLLVRSLRHADALGDALIARGVDD